MIHLLADLACLLLIDLHCSLRPRNAVRCDDTEGWSRHLSHQAMSNFCSCNPINGTYLWCIQSLPHVPCLLHSPALPCLQVSSNQCDLQQLCTEAVDQQYMLAPCVESVQVVLAKSSSPADVLQAFVHARVLSLMLHTPTGQTSDQVTYCNSKCHLSCASSCKPRQ